MTPFPSTTPTERTIWLLRHGERLDTIDSNWKKTAARPFDPPLSEQGQREAQQVAQRLRDESLAHIFVSPFYRTVQTAQPIAKVLNLPLKLEMGFGEWLKTPLVNQQPTLLSLAELQAEFSAVSLAYQSQVEATFPETWAQMLARTAKAVERVLAQTQGDVLIVGHGASTTGVAQALIGPHPAVNMATATLSQFKAIGQSWQILLNGSASHLPERQTNYV